MKEVYLHIGNGGVTFRAESMRKIGEMLIEAAKQPHEVYCCAAEAREETKNSTLSASKML
ncbi:hypothetical protein [Paenibacillus sp. FSL R7-0333]|uniref:hypothetical protein n=1 Tax=Paenibacillus sp. FSL R7-0333 TaxID=1926587 RepID=UPI00096FDF5E|nr:hypothetical protein BK146_17935 [Paenibacillus sp. FSL R7-0333]